MKDKLQELTEEISGVIKKYDIESLFISVALKTDKEGIFDEASLAKGNKDHIVHTFLHSCENDSEIHKIFDSFWSFHLGKEIKPERTIN